MVTETSDVTRMLESGQPRRVSVARTGLGSDMLRRPQGNPPGYSL